jgi:hypothetical protein
MAEPTPANDSFEPDNELEQRLLAAAQGAAEEGLAFEAALLGLNLFAATPEPMEYGQLRAGQKVDLISVTLPDGRAATALFTSTDRLAATFPHAGFVGAPGRNLLGMVRARSVVLNPGHPHAVAWTPEAIETILKRHPSLRMM